MSEKPLFLRMSLPSGIETCLESLAREVLRTQPKNIQEFAAEFFENQLRKRNEEQGLPAEEDISLFSNAPEANGVNGVGVDENGQLLDDGTELESLTGRQSSEGKEEELEMDNQSEIEAAATKIQAGYRGSKARKTVEEMKKEKEEGSQMRMTDESDVQKKTIEVQIPRQSMGEHEHHDFDNDNDDNELDMDHMAEDELHDLDHEKLNSAATSIQAGFRGHKARKEVKNQKEIMDERQTVPKSLEEFNRTIEDELVDIDLSDPQTVKAATTIQAGYRGMSVRKGLEKKQGGGEDHKEISENGHELEMKNEELDENDELKMDNEEDPRHFAEELDMDEMEAAATKIQAGFRGTIARKEIKNRHLDRDKKQEENDDNNELDIDLEDPAVEDAANKIQAGFRGMKTRKELKEKHVEKESAELVDIDPNDPEVERAATKIQAGYKGMRTRKQMKARKQDDENEVLDIDLNDPDVEKAATKIQAGYKGMQTRKNLQAAKEESNAQGDDDLGINLDDPEMEVAATKIQAGYKGMKARKELKESRKDQVEEVDLNDPDLENAATKIQAGFRGMQTRKELRGDEEIVDESALDEEIAATKIQAGFRGMKTRKEMKDGSMPTNLDVCKEVAEVGETTEFSDDAELDKAASKIQAGFKGYKTRKELNQQGDLDCQEPEVQEDLMELAKENSDPRVEGIVHDDLEVREDKEAVIDTDTAATQIQAGFLGLKTRRELQQKLVDGIDNSDVGSERPVEEEVDIDLEDPDVKNAASKIQTGFKSHMASKRKKQKEQEDQRLHDEMDKAATKIQAGYKGMKVRKGMSKKDKDKGDNEDEESLTIISEVNVADQVNETGAIPFEMHSKLNQDANDGNKEEDDEKKHEVHEEVHAFDDSGSPVKDNRPSSSKTNESDKFKDPNHSDNQDKMMLYHYRGSVNSQKVLLYLHERKVPFTAYHVDLNRNEHLTPWFLALNPKAEVPVLRSVDGSKVVSDSTRIIHFIEAEMEAEGQDDHDEKALVPASSDTKLYQLHVYYTALIDQIQVNLIMQGLAFNPDFTLPESRGGKFRDDETLIAMKEALSSRQNTLLQAAEDSSHENVTKHLREKAEYFTNEVLPVITDATKFELLLNQTENTFDKIESQLSCTNTLSSDDDECPMTWLLGGSDPTACDLILGVILNHLALLGFQKRFWSSSEKPRKFLHKLLRTLQMRDTFVKTVPDLGDPDGVAAPARIVESAVSVGNVGSIRVQEPEVKSESIEVWNEIRRGISGDGDKSAGQEVEEEEERTWKSLW